MSAKKRKRYDYGQAIGPSPVMGWRRKKILRKLVRDAILVAGCHRARADRIAKELIP